MRENALYIDSISKSFKDHKVLNEISFTCKPGEIIGFVGYNGCGKSVLFKCICGFIKPDTGKISFSDSNGKEWTNIHGKVGIIIEEPAFLRNKSGMKNLQFLYEISNKKNLKHLRETMQKVGLDFANKKRVGSYSLGMKQRLAVAQAIMENPEILILDEPMNGLDREGIAQMRELFMGLKNQGKIILLASHNKEDIEFLCDTVYELEKGRITEVDLAKNIQKL